MESRMKEKLVQLGHGGGGKLQEELIHFITKGIIKRKINQGIGLDAFDDGASIPHAHGDWDTVITADGHTIEPLIFPGGDLGKLSVCGTVNDLIMMGATPLALTSVYLIEEGFPFQMLQKISDSFNIYADRADVAILAGDTKVMPKNSLNNLVITTSGIGQKPKSRNIQDNNCHPGNKLILTGSIGDHGAALIAQREGIELETDLISDVSLLTPLLDVIDKFPGINAMKDPTRGGLAAALNEWSIKSKVSLWIEEETIPIKKEVQAIADILGLDPLEIANEGKAILCVEASHANEILDHIKKTPIGKDATIIGEVQKKNPKMVVMKTPLGGKRIIEKPMGELIPRIC